MWLAVLTTLVVSHATPELEHVRQDPLTVRGEVGDVARRHGVDGSAVEQQFVQAFKAGGIRVRERAKAGEEEPGATVVVAIDAFEEDSRAGAKIAFTVRAAVRQAVLLPDRRPALADIWSMALIGAAKPKALQETIREALAPLIQRLGDDLGSGHAEYEEKRPDGGAAARDAVPL